MKCYITIVLSLTVFINCLSAQRMLTGKVSDETGKPLVGAQVSLEKDRPGTITDINGAYAIMVPEGQTHLLFNMGKKWLSQKAPLNATNTLNVVMQPYGNVKGKQPKVNEHKR